MMELIKSYFLLEIMLEVNLDVRFRKIYQEKFFLMQIIGNKLVQDLFMSLQSKQMELYGCGDIILLHN